MENSPSNSIEKQIDNFLEHFKRSASKAMEADWCSSGSGSGSGGSGSGGVGGEGLCSSIFSGITANGSAVNQSPIKQPSLQQQQQQPLQHPLLQRTKSRSSCLDISDLSALNVNVQQLRYLTASDIAVLIPGFQLGVRMEFEHLLKEWVSKCILDEKVLGYERAKETWKAPVRPLIETKTQDAKTMIVHPFCRRTTTEPKSHATQNAEQNNYEAREYDEDGRFVDYLEHTPAVSTAPYSQQYLNFSLSTEPPTTAPKSHATQNVEQNNDESRESGEYGAFVDYLEHTPAVSTAPYSQQYVSFSLSTEPPTTAPKSHATQNAEQNNDESRESGEDGRFVDYLEHTPAVSTVPYSQQYLNFSLSTEPPTTVPKSHATQNVEQNNYESRESGEYGAFVDYLEHTPAVSTAPYYQQYVSFSLSTEPPTTAPKSHATQNAEQNNDESRESGEDGRFVDCLEHTPDVSTASYSQQYVSFSLSTETPTTAPKSHATQNAEQNSYEAREYDEDGRFVYCLEHTPAVSTAPYSQQYLNFSLSTEPPTTAPKSHATQNAEQNNDESRESGEDGRFVDCLEHTPAVSTAPYSQQNVSFSLSTEPPTTAPKSHATQNAEQNNYEAREYDEDGRFVYCLEHTPAVSTAPYSQQYSLDNIIPDCLAECQRNYKANGNLLREADRRQLTRAIIHFLVSRKMRFNRRIADEVADQITEYFPTERKRVWFNNQSRGRLLRRFYYEGHKIQAQRTEAMSHLQVMEGYEDKSSSSTQLLDMWKAYWPGRCDMIKRLKPGLVERVDKLLAAWQNYGDAYGTELLAYDFEQLYPHKIELFKERWDIFSTSIKYYLEKRLNFGPTLNLSHDIEQFYTNKVSRECLLLHLMHFITTPSHLYNSPELQSLREKLIFESQHATMRLVDNEHILGSYELYPCIFMVGRKMYEITHCIMAWRDWRFHMPLGDALLAVLQIYLVFKLEIPSACRNFWQFVRDSLCDIQWPDDISCAELDNVKEYIQTVSKK